MLKQLFLTLAILISVTGFISCSKDEPNNGGKDPIENPTDDPKDDPTDDPTDDPKDDPADDGTVIVNADGSTSNGMQFRRIDETNFMLNYVKYSIVSGHLEVSGRDDIEISASLNNKVQIVPAVAIEGTKYITRVIYGFGNAKSLEEIELPNTITDIANGAFSSAKSLRSISLPEGVKEIGDDAFSGCSSLTSVKLNKGLERIGQYAFFNCAKLKSIVIPENTCLILGCFYGTQLEELTLPARFEISSMEHYCIFSSVKNIYRISLAPHPPMGDEELLFTNDIIRQAVLHVPEGSLKSYKESTYWGKFKHIEEYNPESLSQ